MAEQQLPARGLGWTDERWDDYVREGHKHDQSPPKIRLTISRTGPTKGQAPRGK